MNELTKQPSTTIIEINGVKLEVDLRNAKRIDNFKVGDSVKVLRKLYSDNWESSLGVIVGFDEFKNLPTIIIAYLENDYASADIKFAYLNKETQDIEICALHNWDIPYTKQNIINKLDREISKAEELVKEAYAKKECFLKMFGKYFEQTMKQVENKLWVIE